MANSNEISKQDTEQPVVSKPPVPANQTAEKITNIKKVEIGPAANLNFNSNAPINLVLPQGSVPALPVYAANFSYKCFLPDLFHLIVCNYDRIELREFSVLMPKEKALTKCICDDYRRKYARLTPEAKVDLYQYPCLVMNPNRNFQHAGNDQQAAIFELENITILTDNIELKLKPACYRPILQSRLIENSIMDDMDVESCPMTNEYAQVHWTLKSGDLIRILQQHQLLSSV